MKKSFLVILVILAACALDMLFIVDQTEQALVTQFGEPIRTIREPGLQVKSAPFIQKVMYYDKRLLDISSTPEEVILGDTKRVVIESFTRFRIADPLKFFQSLNSEERAKQRVRETINSSLREVLGTVTLPNLLSSSRDTIMKSIRTSVDEKFKVFGIQVVDVRIKRADLPQGTSQSIYDRMKSERVQEAQMYRAQGQQAAQEIRAAAEKERTIILYDAERKAQILRGEGDGKAAKIWAYAANADKEFYAFYRSLESYRKALLKDGTSFILSPDSEYFKYMKKLPGNP